MLIAKRYTITTKNVSNGTPLNEIGKTVILHIATPELISALQTSPQLREVIAEQRVQAILDVDVVTARGLTLLLWNPEHRPN